MTAIAASADKKLISPGMISDTSAIGKSIKAPESIPDPSIISPFRFAETNEPTIAPKNTVIYAIGADKALGLLNFNATNGKTNAVSSITDNDTPPPISALISILGRSFGVLFLFCSIYIYLPLG